MTTVASCSTEDEATVLQSVLAGSGVAAFVRDELSMAYPPNLSGFRLQVADEDAEAARTILADKVP